MPVIRLPSWREVLEGPWALRLRSGSTGPWLMRGEANDDEIDVRLVAGSAARTHEDALVEIGSALEVELESFDALVDTKTERPLVLLMLDTDKLLADDPSQRVHLRVVFQARELPPDAEAVLSEFGVAEIAA
jgi:hypothetical protein